MIRVLAICHEDVEWILGGMGRHVHELYRFMGYRGDVKIDLLNSGSGEGSGVFRSFHRHMSDKLVPWKPRGESMGAQMVSDIQLIKTLLRLVNEGHRWDVIHVHEWPALQVAWAARDALGVPLVATMHLCISTLGQFDGGPQVDIDTKNATLLNKIRSTSNLSKEEEATLRCKWNMASIPGRELSGYIQNQEARLIVESDETILCSKAYAKMAKDYFLMGVIDKPLNMIHNGIDTSVWHPLAGRADRAKAKHHLPWDRDIAFFCGRIAHMKGVEPLLDALESKDTGYCVVMAGAVNAITDDDAEAWSVTQRIRSLQKEHPERLRWLDYQKGQDLIDLYAAADIGLMPSVHEPFGIVALEFMAMGVPLISTEVDGLGEIVVSGPSEAQEHAVIIPPNSPRDILVGMDMLRGKENRDVLRDRGIARVEDFTWEEAAAKTVDVYRKAIGARNAGNS